MLTTTQTGLLSDPATFGGVAFTDGQGLDVRHALVIDRDAACGALRVHRRGTLNVEANLTVHRDAEIRGLVYQLPGSIVAFDSAYHDSPEHGITVHLLGPRAAWVADGAADKPCHLWSSSHGGFAHFVARPHAVTLRHTDVADVLGVPHHLPRTHKTRSHFTLCHRVPKHRPFSFRRLLTRVATLGHFGH